MYRFYNSPARQALLITLALSLAAILLAALIVPVLDADPARIQANALTGNVKPPSVTPAYLAWGVWQRFDTLWYRDIAEHGYKPGPGVVFYPLYPMLIRGAWSIGVPTEIGSVLISRVATFLLLWGLLLLLPLDFDRASVRRAMIFLLLWPTSFILLGAYTEPVLMAATVWSIWFARNNRWWLAAACCLVACLTRAAGMVLLAPLAYLLWSSRSWKAGPIALALVGPFLFPLWLKLNGLSLAGDAYLTHWTSSFAFPWTTVADVFRSFATGDLPVVALNLIAITIAFGLALWKPVRREYFLYALGTLCLLLTANTEPPLRCFIRYTLPVFPVFAAAGRWIKEPAVLLCLWSVAALLNGLMLFTFWNWYFLV